MEEDSKGSDLSNVIRIDEVVSRIFRTLVGGLLWLSAQCVALLEQQHVQISFGRPARASDVA